MIKYISILAYFRDVSSIAGSMLFILEFKKVLIILTDGRSNTGQVSGPSRQLKNSGVVIFSVGIGQSLSMHELREMASEPVDQHLITLNNFTKLASLSKKMSSQTCNGEFCTFCINDNMGGDDGY